jgi:two-component system alkaline phosphatase synthesis response regulator PhoP
MNRAGPGEADTIRRRLLVIDGDTATRLAVREACRQDGFDVVEAGSGQDGIERFEKTRPAAVLLEVALPDISGFDVCREIRRRDIQVPIVFMSPRTEEIDVVVGLEIGADDYMGKPLRLRELLARVSAHLRRVRLFSQDLQSGRLEFKDLLIDLNERRVFRTGDEVELTHTEFDLLAHLAGNAGKVLSRERILNAVWGYEYPIETRVIDVHIRNLRRKVEEHPSKPFYILAVPGIGYRFTNARK